MRRFIALAAALCVCAGGQTQDHGREFKGVLDASAATSTKPAKVDTSDPATCSVGSFLFRSDLTAGSNIKLCTATNTWTLLAGASYTAGAGITFAGNTISVDTTNIPEKDADNIMAGRNTFTGPLGLPNSTTLPATCTVGDAYFDSNAPAGSNLYGCTATNTWTLMGGSSAVQTPVIIKPGTINTTPCVPNSLYTVGGFVDCAGGTFTASESPAAGDIYYHELLIISPGTNTNAMQCTLMQAGTNLLVSTGLTIGTSHTNGSVLIKEYITGSSAQYTSVTGANSAGGSMSAGAQAKTVSNTTPTWDIKCGNATSADADDAVTIALWQISRTKAF